MFCQLGYLTFLCANLAPVLMGFPLVMVLQMGRWPGALTQMWGNTAHKNGRQLMQLWMRVRTLCPLCWWEWVMGLGIWCGRLMITCPLAVSTTSNSSTLLTSWQGAYLNTRRRPNSHLPRLWKFLNSTRQLWSLACWDKQEEACQVTSHFHHRLEYCELILLLPPKCDHQQQVMGTPRVQVSDRKHLNITNKGQVGSNLFISHQSHQPTILMAMVTITRPLVLLTPPLPPCMLPTGHCQRMTLKYWNALCVWQTRRIWHSIVGIRRVGSVVKALQIVQFVGSQSQPGYAFTNVCHSVSSHVN